ncbi:hypothetical protein Q7A53_06055 [Halobacillus rhizosphaerae]|uniref:hypothetical protein n=1 Tax=Halobacillus rhizosphaerae TaxID=3064889 RepID=UPI00398A5569
MGTGWKKNDPNLTNNTSYLDGRVDKLETLQESKAKEIVALTHGLNVVDSDRSTVGSWSMQGRHVVNLIPPFTSSAWEFHSNVTINSSRKLTLNASGNGQHSKAQISASPNKTYILSAKVKGSYVEIKSLDSSGVTIGIVNATNNPLYTTPANTASLIITVSNFSSGVGVYTFEDLVLVEGSQSAEYVQGIKPIVNPVVTSYGKNLFDITNVYNNGSSTTISPVIPTLIDDRTLKLEKSGDSTFHRWTCELPKLISGQQYTLSGKTKILAGGDALRVRVFNSSISLYLPIREDGGKLTFTAPNTSEPVSLILYLNWDTKNEFASVEFSDFMLIVGNQVPTDYTHSTNPTSSWIKEEFYGNGTVNDELIWDENSNAKKIKKWDKVVMDGTFEYRNVAHYTGFTVLGIDIPPVGLWKKTEYVIFKDTGLPLFQMSTTVSTDTTGKDQTYDSITGTNDTQGYIRVTISDEDSAGYDFSTQQGRKDYFNDHPYIWVFQLATPETIDIESEGIVSLHDGFNQVEVGEGTVIKEKVNFYIGGSGTNADWNYSDQKSSLANYYVSKVIKLYKGDEDVTDIIDTFREIGMSATANGQRFYVKTENLDLDATYYVTYIAIDYESAQNKNTKITYDRSLRDSHNTLINTVTDSGQQISVNKWSILELYAELKALEGGN